MAKKHEQEKIDPEQTVQRQARLVVVEHVYYQMPGEDPEHCETSFSRQVSSEEEPYRRRFKVTETPKALDFSWVAKEGVGLFVLENIGPPTLQFNPSPEEAVDPADLAISVHQLNSRVFWLVPLGESARFSPGFDVGENPIMVCCVGSITRCVLHAFPK